MWCCGAPLEEGSISKMAVSSSLEVEMTPRDLDTREVEARVILIAYPRLPLSPVLDA